jgi:hypothetical protein
MVDIRLHVMLPAATNSLCGLIKRLKPNSCRTTFCRNTNNLSSLSFCPAWCPQHTTIISIRATDRLVFKTITECVITKAGTEFYTSLHCTTVLKWLLTHSALHTNCSNSLFLFFETSKPAGGRISHGKYSQQQRLYIFLILYKYYICISFSMNMEVFALYK